MGKSNSNSSNAEEIEGEDQYQNRCDGDAPPALDESEDLEYGDYDDLNYLKTSVFVFLKCLYLTRTRTFLRPRHFSRIKDPESGQLPHGFVLAFEERLQRVLIGRESLPGYSDAAVKRTLADFYTMFTE